MNQKNNDLHKDIRITSSLCRFKIEDEELFADNLVKAEIKKAFNDRRCFSFYPNRDIVSQIKNGANPADFQERYTSMLPEIMRQSSSDILPLDAKTSKDIVSALTFMHYALSLRDFNTIFTRRIVLIRELAGVPTIYHISDQSTAIAHVGQGPNWTEIPSVYLGLNIFATVESERDRGRLDIFEELASLLMIEERAIETGYSHEPIYPPEITRQIIRLVDSVVASIKNYGTIFKEKDDSHHQRQFSETIREEILEGLDARLVNDDLNFDYEKNIQALHLLGSLAHHHKKNGDHESLREIVRLLTAASGHDIHDIRNKANILLERILSPKEFDAPLALTFINTTIGETVEFVFKKPSDGRKSSDYCLKIYRNAATNTLMLESEISFETVEMNYDKDNETLSCSYNFAEYGHYDFALIRRGKNKTEWLTQNEYNGRVNVIPNVQGQIILEIFTDIHGHTKAYWRDTNGHPGLLYNENGEVIRLGNLSDITAHLEHIKTNYFISSIYLLGTQKRGMNKEDWSPEATSASPFSPMSLVDIEPSVGGEQELRKLIARAHKLGIKVLLDIVPHINRKSTHLPQNFEVMTYDNSGNLVPRSSTDGRYGSWNDGKLLNYRMFEVWEWLSWSINTLIDKFDIDGVRFDSAHAVPIMMKKNNFPFIYDKKRTHEEMAEGTIIVNEREYDHFITTGYYDCDCRNQIAVPIHYYIMLNIERKLREKGKSFFLNIAECFWGHERFLTRTGLIPYNSSLFKICENIIHLKTDVREIYHIYDNYYPSALPRGTELLGILGNHDERRALNTFGHRGLRAAIGLTFFLHDIVMDYEGSAEGESWKVFLDNIYVNWNQFESVASRSLASFYKYWYNFHSTHRGKGYLIWANNHMTAAAMKFTSDEVWIGAFNFADANQNIALQFDNPSLPIPDDTYYRLSDIIYSEYTGKWSYFSGKELKISQIKTVVSFTERIKLFKLESVDIKSNYSNFLRDSFLRLAVLSQTENIASNFAFGEFAARCRDLDSMSDFLIEHVKPLTTDSDKDSILRALKRILFYLYKHQLVSTTEFLNYKNILLRSNDKFLRFLGTEMTAQNKRGPIVFMSAEANPFSKSGGLANVVYELPAEMVKMHEEVYVITGYYRYGSDAEKKKMDDAVKKYNVTYTGVNISFFIMGERYEVGVHSGIVNGITYFLLDHYEFFDGLYWGYTASEKLRRRIAFARSCAEVITTFKIRPRYTFTNDAYIGLFNGIVRCDPYYANSDFFARTSFFHIIHNGGWQYFDAYDRFENGFDFFNFFNLPSWRLNDFCDPVFTNRLSCMATGIRFADMVITVSPFYAEQIKQSCDGMEHILHNVIGISNAIGGDFKQNLAKNFTESGFLEKNYERFIALADNNASLMKKIKTRYPEILKGLHEPEHIGDPARRAIVTRVRNKLLLQTERNLTVDPDILMFCMIHRISDQKGFQLLLEASEGIFGNLGYQGIIGGAVASGDNRGRELVQGLNQIASYYKNSISFTEGYQDITIPLLSADIFCMPSMHEPGGISQLEAFAAGCIVVARATGGLRDTISPLQIQDGAVKGDGFLFSDYHSWSFYDAMERAKNFFVNNSEELVQAARFNAESSIYYWDRPARKYIETIYDFTETIRLIE